MSWNKITKHRNIIKDIPVTGIEGADGSEYSFGTLQDGLPLSVSGQQIVTSDWLSFAEPTSGYRETTGTVYPTAIIWYNVPGATKKKVVEKLITWDVTGVPTTIVYNIYNSSEVLIRTIRDTISYSGIFETNRTRTIT